MYFMFVFIYCGRETERTSETTSSHSKETYEENLCPDSGRKRLRKRLAEEAPPPAPSLKSAISSPRTGTFGGQDQLQLIMSLGHLDS